MFTRQWRFRAITLRAFSQSQRGADRRRTSSAAAGPDSRRITEQRLKGPQASDGASEGGWESCSAAGLGGGSGAPDVESRAGLRADGSRPEGAREGVASRGPLAAFEVELSGRRPQQGQPGEEAAGGVAAAAAAQTGRPGRPALEQAAAAAEGSGGALHHSMRSIASGRPRPPHPFASLPPPPPSQLSGQLYSTAFQTEGHAAPQHAQHRLRWAVPLPPVRLPACGLRKTGGENSTPAGGLPFPAGKATARL